MHSLDKDSIERIDPEGMLGDVLAQPLQLGDALWRAESAGIRPRDMPGGLVVCGMGGSGIGGDLAVAALGDRATRQITVVRDYGLEAWTPPESLVLCSSYSGETEETLACFEAAGAAGARRVVMTTGGTLARLAREEDVPVIGVPSGMQPRAAVVYMTIGAMECAALCGAAPGLRSEIDTATALLERLVEEWGPGGDGRLAREADRAPARRHDPGDPRRGRHDGARRGGGPPRSRRTRTPRPSGPSSPRGTTTRSAAGSAAASRRPSPASSSATPTSTRA